MTLPRVRPPAISDERTQLLGWLDLQRSIVSWKCEGLSDADAHRALMPTSPLMTVAGVLAHLRWTENAWFEVLFPGGPTTGNPQFREEPEDADMMAEGVPLAELVEAYERQCEASNAIIAAHSLDDVGRHPEYMKDGATLRWIVIHMVEETARHAGHLDTLREQLDGRVGYF